MTNLGVVAGFAALFLLPYVLLAIATAWGDDDDGPDDWHYG
jgi:hypothetical protein